MRAFQTIILCLLLSGSLYAQQFDERIADTRTPLESVERALMPALDNDVLLQAELERRGPGIAPRFAEVIDVNISPDTDGNWEVLSNGNAVWRLQIKSTGAKSLNLGFTKFIMPQGGSLIIYSPDKKKVMGPFTPADNEEHEELWTPVFDGDELVIEVQLPDYRRDELQLELKTVNHDFLGFSTVVSGSCNLDVICGADDGWALVDNYRDIIQSVAVYGTGGSTFCTGFLVNNTRNDCTPLFMTANHCMTAGSAPSMVVYWNYINSVCRQPNTGASGGPGDGTLADFNTGSTYLANYGPSDFFLVELDDEVSETANAFFSGWSAVPTLPGADTLIGIHHPSTDEKRISFEFDAPHVGEWGSGDAEIPTGNHVIIPDWDIGTTEGGSSGSPLFDGNKRVIGQLHGGAASCGNNAYDSYGWVAASWEGGGTPQSRLRDWLDPDDTGVLFSDGREQAICSFAVIVDNPIIDICAGEETVYYLTISEAFTDSVTLSLEGVPDGIIANISINPAAPGSSDTLTISNTDTLATGAYEIIIIGTGGDQTVTSNIYLNVFAGAPSAIELVNPANASDGEVLSPPFSWTPMAGAATYSFVLATDPEFTNIVAEANGLTEVNTVAGLLETQTTYYWMVTGSNICGEGEPSEVFSFTTAAITCDQVSTAVPVEISDSGEVTVTSEIEVSVPGLISDVRIDNLDITHTWVGDLTATLTSPSGTEIIIFARPGEPASFYGCDGDDILGNFYDTALNSAEDFENTCGGLLPAIEGDFQPIDAFSQFIGENGTGTWTLSVSDAFNQDGGELVGWDITICTVIPDEAALFTATDIFSSCVDEAVSFEILAGTGFDGSAINLTAESLPDGASATFSENPMSPGSTVTVTISGASASGLYDISIIGDDGNSLTNLSVTLDLAGPPAPIIMSSPANGNIDEPTGLTLSWESSADALSYIVTVATDPDFNEILVSNTQTNTNYNLSGLALGTSYYWQVQNVGECGTTNVAEVFSFTTIPDISVSLSPGDATACLADEVTFEIQVGSGFSAPVNVSFTTSTGETPVVTYNVEPDDITPGTTITATVGGFGTLTSDVFDITFTFSDGNYSSETSANIQLQSAPELPVQTFPANGVSFMDPNISLLWDGVDNAESYFVEVSDSDLFDNIVESATVTATLYTLSNITDPGIYFWRITAINECGSSITSAITFIYTPVATRDLNGKQVSISPNPTSGDLNIELSTTVDDRVVIEVFSIDGKVMQKHFIEKGQSGISLSLEGYASGVYMVKFTDGNARLARRIILQE